MTMSHSDDFSSTDDFRRMIIHLQRTKIICNNNNIVFNIDILVEKKNLLRQQKEYVASPEKKVFKTNFSRPP